MADAKRLIALGMVPPLAKEVAAQITAGVGNARRLVELSVVPILARELANQINSGTGNARRLAELGMVPVMAKEVAAQVSSGGTSATYLPTFAGKPAYFALGAKRMVPGYTGTVFSIRRLSDGATMAVTVDAGSDLPNNYAAIATWAGVSKLTAFGWVDQYTGNVVGAARSAGGSGSRGNECAFDLSLALAGCVPLLWDYERTTTAAGLPIIQVLGLAIPQNNFTVADVVESAVTAQDNCFWKFGDGAAAFATIYSSLTTTANQQMGLAFFSPASVRFPAATTAPRCNPDVMIGTQNATGFELHVRDTVVQDTASAAPGTQSMASFSMGYLAANANYSRLARWGIVVYPALTTAEATTLRTALRTMFSIPTAFAARVIVDVDSIAEGSGSDRLRNTIRQVGLASSVEVFNIAVHGQTFATEASKVGGRVVPLLTTAYGVANCVTIAEGGINDITSDVTGSTLYTTATSYRNAIAAQGAYPVLLQTLLPWSTVADYTSGRDTQRLAYNSAVNGNAAGFTSIIDAANDAVMGGAAGPGGTADNTTYYYDKKHPTGAGYLRLAQSQYRPALVALGIPMAA